MKKATIWVLSIHLILVVILLGDHWVRRGRAPKKAMVIRSVQISQLIVASAPAKPTPKPGKKTVAAAPKPSKKPQAIKQTPAPQAAPKPTLSIPALPSLPVPEIVEEKTDPNLLVASYLQELLKLPEFGEVKVLLCINKAGIVESLEILESKSEKNQEFLKNRLAEISFPWLNEETKLTLVFRNE